MRHSSFISAACLFCAFLAVFGLLVPACGDDLGDPSVCGQAEESLGKAVCVNELESEEQWSLLAEEVNAVDQVRSTRYLVPARSDARLPTLIEDSRAGYLGHYQFLRQAFSDLFPSFSLGDYTEITLRRDKREFFTGRITEYIDPGGARIFGFIAWSEQNQEETLSCDEAREVYRSLADSFSLRPLAIVPTDGFQRGALSSCEVPVYDAAQAVEYEAYSPKKVYGRIRRYKLEELPQATLEAEFGFQDILIIDQAPIDIETIVSGTVTGERQGELSHLNVRASARGTANCYLRGAYSRLQQYEGKIVSLECKQEKLEIFEASLAEAEAFWDELRPDPVSLPKVISDQRSLVSLLDMSTENAADRSVGLRSYGAKAKNLATLYQRLPSDRRFPGFAVPFAYYQEFLVDNGLDLELENMLADPEFQSDAKVRRAHLQSFRSLVEAGTCDPALLSDLHEQIDAVFGDSGLMLRFRSSSNAEDTLEFNGAGLYRSTSVCPQDDRDADGIGPSACDPSKASERGLCRGLKKVWASLWSSKAYEEREWFSMDHSRASMAVLVNPRSANEQANIVAFTENPFAENDRRFLINAQLGELEVVGEPGVSPEKNLLRVDSQSGALLEITRARRSSVVAEGEVVLSDLQLEELAQVLWLIQQVYPIDESAADGKRVILDTEWKITESGQLVVKQVRPFASE